MTTARALLRDHRRALGATAFAIVVHGAALFAVSSGRVPRPDATTGDANANANANAIEIALVDELETLRDDTAVPRPRPREEEERQGGVASGAASSSESSERARGARPVDETPGEANAAGETAAPNGVVPMFVKPAPAAIGLAGSGAPNPFVGQGEVGGEAPAGPPRDGPSSAAPGGRSAADAKRAVEQSLRQGSHERDVARGLGPEGPVLTALRDATYASIAPDRGSAVFVAVVDGGGSVVDLRVAASNGDARGWEDARARALRALAGVKIALRGARGAELRIEVASDVVLPSGSRARIRPTLEPSQISVSESGLPSDNVASATIARFDVSDVGAKPRRVVRARATTVTLL